MEVDSFDKLEQDVVSCELCPRLRRYCEGVARVKKAAFRHWEYWGRPVPGFGDPGARLALVGLAPAAHGANRTGRMLTGDLPNGASVFVMQSLFDHGFASQPTSLHRDDGLKLFDCYLTAAVRCAPPDNKPLPAEFDNCRPYLIRELRLLTNLRVILVFGSQALRSAQVALGELGLRQRLSFAHGAKYRLREDLTLFCSYHPSRQNTQTGRLTRAAFDEVLRRVKREITPP